ncbi:MAG: peptidylprolyl isomerase [Melioribacteraceae bacterium]|nr:peptidylprolyl isomerase [Melioribacteraceae bacterium]
MIKYLLVILLSINLILEATTNPDSVVASIGNLRISKDEFINGYEFGPSFFKKEIKSKNVFLDFLVNEKLLALDGYTKKLDTSIAYKNIYNAFLSDIASEEMFKNEILPKVMISSAEIDTVAKQKLINIEIDWIYSDNQSSMALISNQLKKGASFDSLWNKQLVDSITKDDRYLRTTRFQLGEKNPLLASVIDSLEAGHYGLPIKTNDGFYIVRLLNFDYRLTVSEGEEIKVREEAKNAIKLRKSEKLSSIYIDSLMRNINPIIKRKAFQILRSYLAQSYISKENYSGWKLDSILKDAFNYYDSLGIKSYSKIELIEIKNGSVSLSDFFNWFQVRSQYIKMKDDSFENFSRSLESLVWQMLRDELLSSEAKKKGYNTNIDVITQMKLWNDKIMYATVKNELLNSITLNKKEINNSETETELNKKILKKLVELKKKYQLKINKTILDSIEVSEENNPNAIDFYFVKRGGLIPRTPYPVLDIYWAGWL